MDLSTHLLPEDWEWFARNGYVQPEEDEDGLLVADIVMHLLPLALVALAVFLLLGLSMRFTADTGAKVEHQQQERTKQIQKQADLPGQKGMSGPPEEPGQADCVSDRQICSVQVRGGKLYVTYGDGSTEPVGKVQAPAG
jgi:hypothetical protein